jgi:hypothetical protein
MNNTLVNLLIEDLKLSKEYTLELETKDVKCSCGWSGKLKDSEEEIFNDIQFMSGWAGLLYMCPQCSTPVNRNVLVRS